MKNTSQKSPTCLELERQAEAVRERINALEVRRTVLRGEIDNPPAESNVYYFTTRLDEVRTITMIIDAVRPLL